MKNSIVLLLVCFGLFSGNAIAQTKYRRHLMLSNVHTKVRVLAFNSIEESSLDAIKMNLDEAGKNLENAIARHQELRDKMPEKYRANTKPHHDAIDKYHQEAIGYYEAMQAEVHKRYYSEKKIKEYAKNIDLAILKAENEHQLLISKTS